MQDGIQVQPRTYRYPTSILWINNGWREITAESVEGALAAINARYSSSSLGAENLQVLVGGEWRWATETLSS